MELLDNSNLGLIIWGTKRGKSVFLSSNLAENADDLNKQLSDIQSFTSFQRVGHEFYCFDLHQNFKGVSIIYSLNDALSRMGYLVVTLVIPRNKTFRENQNNSRRLLKQLLDLYMEKYVISEFITKTINPTAREDVGLFESVLRSSRSELVPADNFSVAKVPGACYLKFNDEIELDDIFEHYEREELRAYEKVFVLPNVSNDLSANINFTELPPAERKVTLKIRTLDRGGMLYNVTLNIEASKFPFISLA